MIREILKRGEQNGTTEETLASIFDCSRREIRRQIHRERVDGAVILGGDSGFYLPSLDPDQARDEIRHFVNRSKSRAREILESAKGACKALQELDDREPAKPIS